MSNATIMSFVLLSLRKECGTYLLGVILALTADVITCGETFGQTVAYTVSDISAAGVPCRLNNLGDVTGRGGDSSSGETRATIWNHGSLRPTTLGSLWGAAH